MFLGLNVFRRRFDFSSCLLINSIFLIVGVKALLELDYPSPLFGPILSSLYPLLLSHPASGEAGASDGTAVGLLDYQFIYVIMGAMFGTSVDILEASCSTGSGVARTASFFEAGYASSWCPFSTRVASAFRC